MTGHNAGPPFAPPRTWYNLLFNEQDINCNSLNRCDGNLCNLLTLTHIVALKVPTERDAADYYCPLSPQYNISLFWWSAMYLFGSSCGWWAAARSCTKCVHMAVDSLWMQLASTQTWIIKEERSIVLPKPVPVGLCCHKQSKMTPISVIPNISEAIAQKVVLIANISEMNCNLKMLFISMVTRNYLFAYSWIQTICPRVKFSAFRATPEWKTFTLYGVSLLLLPPPRRRSQTKTTNTPGAVKSLLRLRSLGTTLDRTLHWPFVFKTYSRAIKNNQQILMLS